MSRPRIELDVDHRGDALVVSWRDGRAAGSCSFVHAPGARPEWLAAAEDLTEGASRRAASAILDALAGWAIETGTDIGVWHEDGEVEPLGDPSR